VSNSLCSVVLAPSTELSSSSSQAQRIC